MSAFHGQFPFFHSAEAFDAVCWDTDVGQFGMALGVSVGVLYSQHVRAFDAVLLRFTFDVVQLGVAQELFVAAVVV